MKQLSKWYLKTFRKKSGKLPRGRDLIVMKLTSDVPCQLPDLCIPNFRFIFQIMKKKSSEKIPGGWELCWDPPSDCLWTPRGRKLPSHNQNQYSSRHMLYKYVYQFWRLYIIAAATNGDKLLWPFLAVMYVRVTWFWWNSNSMCDAAY